MLDSTVLTSVAAGRRGFNKALAVACPAHGAPAGYPCWQITSDREHQALCGRRVRVSGQRGKQR